MTDIVERLRELDESARVCEVCREAADEIERLRGLELAMRDRCAEFLLVFYKQHAGGSFPLEELLNAVSSIPLLGK